MTQERVSVRVIQSETVETRTKRWYVRVTESEKAGVGAQEKRT